MSDALTANKNLNKNENRDTHKASRFSFKCHLSAVRPSPRHLAMPTRPGRLPFP